MPILKPLKELNYKDLTVRLIRAHDGGIQIEAEPTDRNAPKIAESIRNAEGFRQFGEWNAQAMELLLQLKKSMKDIFDVSNAPQHSGYNHTVYMNGGAIGKDVGDEGWIEAFETAFASASRRLRTRPPSSAEKI